MLTIDYVKEHIDEIEQDEFMDRRFTKRFIDYLPVEEWERFGFEYKGEDNFVPKTWTEENIKAELKDDLKFAIEKALGHRGISASLMYDVLKSWCIILENGLEKTGYGWYGDKLIKAIDEYYEFGIYKAADFIESRIEHAKECIVKALYDEGYTIDDFYEDGMLIDLDGIGLAKVKIQKAD